MLTMFHPGRVGGCVSGVDGLIIITQGDCRWLFNDKAAVNGVDELVVVGNGDCRWLANDEAVVADSLGNGGNRGGSPGWFWREPSV